MMPFLSDFVFCFDLDDTLYKEIDYLKSAYGEIASIAGHPEAVNQMIGWYQSGENTFNKFIETYGLNISISDCLKIYREHNPHISLDKGVKELLLELKEKGANVGIITDGRSLTQRNKIRALGLEGFFDIEIISEDFGTEKPCLNNFQAVMDKFPQKKYIYIGDNTAKDFLAPNRLGWATICLLNDGRNIHVQNFQQASLYLPKFTIKDISALRHSI